MVTNIFIDSIMEKVRGYRGTFSSNNAPKLKKNQSAILNFSKVNEEGTHFIAILIHEKKCLYFDPLSIEETFIPKEIKKYLKKYEKVVNFSKKIQNDYSDFCGFFCMMFILSFSISKKFLLKVFDKFKSDAMKNDEICINVLSSAINKYFKVKNRKK